MAHFVVIGLELHPTKTKIVYCKDGKRTGAHEHTAFTFLQVPARLGGVTA